MIAFVAGKLAQKKPTLALVNVQGIGYQVFIPTSTYEKLPEKGADVQLHTYLYVREDALLLYGFASVPEKVLFERMIAVSGIGPKLALAALSAMPPAELRSMVMEGNTGMLTKIPGVGRKMAERMVVELRDPFSKLDAAEGGMLTGTADGDAKATARADALAALEALGLSRAAAERNLRKVLRANPGIQSAEELIRLALRES